MLPGLPSNKPLPTPITSLGRLVTPIVSDQGSNLTTVTVESLLPKNLVTEDLCTWDSDYKWMDH